MMTATVRSNKSFSTERVMSADDALEIIFPATKTRKAARLLTLWFARKGGTATRNALSKFADELSKGIEDQHGVRFKYSRRNLYMTVMRTLIDMGFIQKNVPSWDTSRSRTVYLYSRNIFDIPKKPPTVGFWRLAYYTCRKWNDMFLKEKTG